MENKVKYYQIGVEILDRNTKRPIEHRECEKEYRLDEAMKVYNEFKLQNDEQKYLNAVMEDDSFATLKSAQRVTTGRVLCRPLDLESADGFVIDMSTPELTYLALEDVLSDPFDRADLIKETDVNGLRDFILEYYISTYEDAYILVKEQNVYQIIEEYLYVRSDK